MHCIAARSLVRSIFLAWRMFSDLTRGRWPEGQKASRSGILFSEIWFSTHNTNFLFGVATDSQMSRALTSWCVNCAKKKTRRNGLITLLRQPASLKLTSKAITPQLQQLLQHRLHRSRRHLQKRKSSLPRTHFSLL